MKKHFYLLISVLLIFVELLNAQQTEVFTFFDKFAVGTDPNTVETILPKSERLSSERRGKIIANTSSNMPDSMRICIDVAVSNWQSYLDNNATIVLYFEYEDIAEDYDIGTDVLYWTDKENKTFYPQCLAKYLGLSVNVDDLDATIHINKYTTWDCGYSNKIKPGTNNLTYAIFRSIAHVIGFGSSVRDRGGSRGITFYSTDGYSIFDKLIFTPTKRLEDVPNTKRENQELKDFCLSNSGAVYALKNDAAYQLYAPSTGFEPYRSLQYFSDKNSLMSYDLQSGEKFLRVDDRTLEVLHAIGWNIREQSHIKIVGQNLSDNGIASAYESNNFKVENYSGYSISQSQWTYTLPLKDGGEDVVATSNAATFTIPAVEDINKYAINVDGDINGLITFKCIINGEETIALYNITLELKPKIISYSEIVKTINETNTTYSIDFAVHYVGKDYLSVGVKEDYSPFLEIEIVEEPYVAHVHRSGINTFDYAWVILSVENQYGEDEVIITLENLISSSFSEYNLTKNSQVSREFMNVSFIKVFTKEGKYVMQVKEIDSLNKLDKDIYILQFYDSNSICFKTIKYMKM